MYLYKYTYIDIYVDINLWPASAMAAVDSFTRKKKKQHTAFSTVISPNPITSQHGCCLLLEPLP